MRRLLDAPTQFVLDVFRQALEAAHDTETNVVVLKGFEFAADVELEQTHEAGDFIGGPLPVFGREGVHREGFEAETGRGLDHRADRLHTGAMTFKTRQEPALRPAAVAVHDDRHVPGKAIEIDRVHKRPLVAVGACDFENLRAGHEQRRL